MNKAIENLRVIPGERPPERKGTKSLAEKKAENARIMQERARAASPDLVADREKSEKILAEARARAQEALSIDASHIGEEAKRTESERMQNVAAQRRGYASAAAMKQRAQGERATFMQKAATWLEQKWGITIRRDEDRKKQDKAA